MYKFQNLKGIYMKKLRKYTKKCSHIKVKLFNAGMVFVFEFKKISIKENCDFRVAAG